MPLTAVTIFCQCCRQAELGNTVANDYKTVQRGDEIHAILQHSGISSASLSRFEEVAATMYRLEWSLARRAAVDAKDGSLPARVRMGD
jgi:hypothetical protein